MAIRLVPVVMAAVVAVLTPPSRSAVAAVSSVVFNTDVTVAGREETVWVTATSPGTVNLQIDFNRDGTFEPSEQVVTDQPVITGANRVVYTVPTAPAFVPGTGALARVTSSPDGGFVDVTRELFDAEDTAMARCPAGMVPIPVSIIQNPSFETRTGNFQNVTAANTINFAQNWFDSHPTGGQYHVFDPPTFDSGPAAVTMPIRAGADGQGFLGGHSGPAAVGEGATNTLLVPLNPDATYVGFFSIAAAGYGRQGNGFMEFFGVSNRSVGHIPGGGVVAPTPQNSELLFATPVVDFPGVGVRPIWQLSTFTLDPSQAWPFLRVEVRNETPANNATVAGQVWMNFDDFHMFECAPRLLQDTKTSTATPDTRLGDTITYRVTATNVGAADFTADAPAVVLDDLAGVLDEATYNDDATADVGPAPTFDSPRLTWSGPLVSGATVTITYSVTLTGGGDGVVRNVAFQSRCVPGAPDCPAPPTPEPCVDNLDPATGLPCDDVVIDLPRLTIVKSASSTDLPATGEPLTYTVTVTNVGPGDYTATAPATMTDDLSDVIDDTSDPAPIAATVGNATFASPNLSWSGVLAAGESAVITYTVTYDGTGSQRLVNLACVPADQALDPQLACIPVSVPGSGLVQVKFADPPSDTPVDVGDIVTYTLAFTNTGSTTATVDTTDDLTDVLDDATLTAGPTADPGLTAIRSGDTIVISGSVPVNQRLTVTYTVTVDAFADQADHVLRNALACQPGDPQPCPPQTTEHPVRHLTVDKTSAVAPDVNIGDVITYTLTIGNDGAGDYTALEPAQISDDLTGVLDDAIYNDDATANVGTTNYSAPVLSWSGALDAGAVAVVTYAVTVTSAGDHNLDNTAQVAACSDDPACTTSVNTPLPHVFAAKASDPASGSAVQPGDVISYRLTFTNDGLAAGPVDATDNLADVLDDADVTTEPVSSLSTVTAVRTGNRIRITGTLDPATTATVTYQVTIRPDGQRDDNITRNVLTLDVPPLVCDATGCTPMASPSTEHPIGQLDASKTVEPPSGSTVQPGTAVTYTLRFANIGEAPVNVNRDDVVTDVLDDATITTNPVSSDPALTVSPIRDGRFAVTGTLAPGQKATVTYTVTIKPAGQRGNDRLDNFLVEPGEPPPDNCATALSQLPDCTTTLVASVTVTKTSDPPDGNRVQPGDQVTYTVTITNVSTNPASAPATVDYTDHLLDVLDDATLTGPPQTSSTALDARRTGDTIRITGQLATGQTATVTYTVTVKPYDQQGDHTLRNLVSTTGDPPECTPLLCTDHIAEPAAPRPIPPTTTPPATGTLPTTGSDVRTTLQLVMILTATGACLLILSHRRRHTSDSSRANEPR